MSCNRLHNATFLPAWAFGPWRYVAPVGPMTAQYGPAPAPANLSPRQAKAAGLMTSGTCGPRFIGSFGNADLEPLLVSRLQARLRNLGSTLYKLTWKPWVMPSGHLRSRLRASVRRTSETVRTGWVTPTSRDHKDSPGMVAQRDGKDRIDQLPRQAYLVGWPTPHTSASTGAGTQGRAGGLNIQSAAALAGWPTATANDAEKRGTVSYRPDKPNGLNATASLSGWPTTRATLKI